MIAIKNLWTFITKFAIKGLVNLGKLVPGVGAVIGGSLDYFETKTIGNRAYKWFFESDFADNEEANIDCDIDLEELSE